MRPIRLHGFAEMRGTGERGLGAARSLDVRKVHVETLRPLVEARVAESVSATTINRTLEIARAILDRAARAYRDAQGDP